MPVIRRTLPVARCPSPVTRHPRRPLLAILEDPESRGERKRMVHRASASPHCSPLLPPLYRFAAFTDPFSTSPPLSSPLLVRPGRSFSPLLHLFSLSFLLHYSFPAAPRSAFTRFKLDNRSCNTSPDASSASSSSLSSACFLFQGKEEDTVGCWELGARDVTRTGAARDTVASREMIRSVLHPAIVGASTKRRGDRERNSAIETIKITTRGIAEE